MRAVVGLTTFFGWLHQLRLLPDKCEVKCTTGQLARQREVTGTHQARHKGWPLGVHVKWVRSGDIKKFIQQGMWKKAHSHKEGKQPHQPERAIRITCPSLSSFFQISEEQETQEYGSYLNTSFHPTFGNSQRTPAFIKTHLHRKLIREAIQTPPSWA